VVRLPPPKVHLVPLTLPFFLYGFAFFLVDLSVLPPLFQHRYWLGNVGTRFYAAASASGPLHFALNFGDEGGSPVKDWVYRACIIRGTQQIYVVALWYWGSKLTARAVDSVLQDSALSPLIAAIIILVAVALWAIYLILAFGLPDYYRQLPGKVPAFYSTILRRNIVKMVPHHGPSYRTTGYPHPMVGIGLTSGAAHTSHNGRLPCW